MIETKRSRFGADHVQDEETPSKPKLSPDDWQFLMISTIVVTIATVILLLLLF